MSIPDIPAIICSYLMCEKRFNFPLIFFGDIAVDADDIFCALTYLTDFFNF